MQASHGGGFDVDTDIDFLSCHHVSCHNHRSGKHFLVFQVSRFHRRNTHICLRFSFFLFPKVSVMEDELDRRGVPRPMPTASDNTSHTNSSSNTDEAANTTPAAASTSTSTNTDELSRLIASSSGDVTTPVKSKRGGGGDGDEAGAGTRAGTESEGPLLSPRGRGYLARLVLEVCSELEASKKKEVCVLCYFFLHLPRFFSSPMIRDVSRSFGHKKTCTVP